MMGDSDLAQPGRRGTRAAVSSPAGGAPWTAGHQHLTRERLRDINTI